MNALAWCHRAIAAFFLLTTTHAMPQTPPATDNTDPFLWLEDVQGERALNWVRERNAVSQKELTARPEFASIRAQVFASTDC